jgi:uncharacterized glyoxalase superfamily protein PhnB
MAKKKVVKSKAAKKAAQKTVKKAVAKAAAKAVKKVLKARARQAAKTTPNKAVKKVARKAVKKSAARPLEAQHGRAPDSPQLIPSLTVRSMADSVHFYEAAFGFKLEFTVPGPDGRPEHGQMTFFGARIMISPEGAYGGTVRAPATSGQEQPIQSYVYCPDVDAFTARARAAGAKILMEPADMFWGDRMTHLEDLNGYRWAFATFQRPFDPSKVPSPQHG